MLSACFSTPDKAYKPAAIPPTTVQVPVWGQLPPGALTPCPEPTDRSADITIDTDLLGVLARWIGTSDCNAGKLNAASEAMKQPPKVKP